jgi:hypothetical protein
VQATLSTASNASLRRGRAATTASARRECPSWRVSSIAKRSEPRDRTRAV